MQRFLPLCSLLILVACSSDETTGPAGGAPAVLRPAFQRVEPRERRPLRLVTRIEVPSDLADWTIDADTHAVEGDPDERALALPAGGTAVVTIPHAITPGEVNQIVVRGEFRKAHTIGLRLLRENGRHVKVRAMAAARRKGEQPILFDLALLRQAKASFSALELTFAGPAPGLTLLSVDLLDKPIEHYLPDCEDEDGLASVLTETRAGFGLLKDETIEARFAVVDATQTLRFGCGMLQDLRANGTQPRVLATVEGGGREVERTVLLENARDEGQRWHDEAVPLADFVGEEVRVSFTLVTDHDRPALCALSQPTIVLPAQDAPTVVLVTSDTHRGDHIGLAERGVEIDTPALDALARRGVFFEDAYATTNITSPSHVSLLTGLHPRDTRLVTNTGHIGSHARTLAEAFRAAGWATAGVVSVRHLGGRGTGLGQGFDRILDPPAGGPWPAAEPVDIARGFLDEADGLPLFVWVHVFDAHEPYLPPASHDRLYYPADADPYDPALPAIEGRVLPPSLAKVRDLEFPKAQYRAEITYLDEQLGRLFAHPRVAAGWACVTSDHGEVLTSGERYFNHGYVSRSTLHVPLVLAGPGVPTGVRCAAPTRQLDVGRTLLDLAGLAAADFPGRNLLRALEAEPQVERPRFGLSNHGNTAVVQRGRWMCRLCLREHSGARFDSTPAHVTELFDLETDPECAVDLSESEPARTRALRAEIIAWLDAAQFGEDLTVSGGRSADEVAELAAMGYATGTEEREGEAWFDASCACAECEEWR